MKNLLPTLVIAFGGLIVGFALGYLTTQNDNFHPDQLEYINGVAQGVVYVEDKNHAHDPGEPKQRCVQEFYPDRPIALAGCFEAINGRQWVMPP